MCCILVMGFEKVTFQMGGDGMGRKGGVCGLCGRLSHGTAINSVLDH